MKLEMKLELEEIIRTNEELKKTFIGDFTKVLKTKSFIDDLNPVLPNEEIVGQLNDSEKALFSLIVAYQAAEKEISIKLQEENALEKKERFKLTVDLARCKSRLQAANGIFGESIVSRFSSPDRPDIKGWHVRSGFQVICIKTIHLKCHVKKSDFYIDERGAQA